MASLPSAVASISCGYVIGFGYLTAWDALKLTRDCRNPARALFTWMVWGEIFVSYAIAIGSWLFAHGYIKPSVPSLFLILVLWVFQVHFILQIIINRVSIISRTPTTPNRIRIATAVGVTILNVSIFATFIPAALQVSPGYVVGGWAWVKIVKILIMLIDCFLNFYFISQVRENLAQNGLRKYEKLCRFNMSIIIVSVGFDLLLFGTTFLPGPLTFVPFLSVVYITKLKIELSMTKLIRKIARQSLNQSSGQPAPSKEQSVSTDSYASKSTPGHSHAESVEIPKGAICREFEVC